MTQNLTALLAWYKSSEGQGVTANETQILKTIQEAQVWDTLSDQQKQALRRERIHYDKIKFPDDLKRSIDYEEKVVALIDAIMLFIQSTENELGSMTAPSGGDETLLFRLRTMMICEKEFAMRFPKIKNVGHVPWIVVQPLFDALKRTPYHNQYHLQALQDMYAAMDEANRQSPYSNNP